MVVFCEECGQKHTIELDGENSNVSQYKCNVCGHSMKIHFDTHFMELDKNQPIVRARSVPSVLDELLKEKSDLDVFLACTLDKQGLFFGREGLNGKDACYLAQAKDDLDAFLANIINGKQDKSRDSLGSNLSTDNAKSVKSDDMSKSNIAINNVKPSDPGKLKLLTDRMEFVSNEDKADFNNRDALQFFTKTEEPMQQSFESWGLRENKTSLVKHKRKKDYHPELSAQAIILIMVLIASASIFSIFYYGIGETIFEYALNIFDYIVKTFDYLLAISQNFLKYMLNLIGK